MLRSRLRPQRSLFFLGLTSALFYLLAFALPYWLPANYLRVEDEIYAFAAREPWRGILFYLALGGLFGLYWLACRLARQAQSEGAGCQEQAAPPLRWPAGGLWPVMAWTFIFCLLLIPVQPLTASDLYTYAFLGRVTAVLDQNPFVHMAGEFAGDPFYFTVTFPNLPVTCGYGPLWVVISALLGWLTRDQLLLNLFLFKGLAAGLHLASSALVYGILKRVAPEYRVVGALFYAWNPLLLYELVGNGHNDAAVAVLVLLAFFLLSLDNPRSEAKSGGRGLWAILCLAAAALIKAVAVLWLPLAALWLLAQVKPRLARLRQATAIALLVLATVVAAYAPFWVGTATLQGLVAQSDIYGNSLASLAIHSLSSLWPDSAASWVQMVKLATGLVFAPFYLVQLYAVSRSARLADDRQRYDGLVRASFDVMLFYLLFVGLQFLPWYLAWLMIPAAVVGEACFGRRRCLAVLFCVLAPLLYFPFGAELVASRLPPWGVAFLSALPIAACGLWLAIQAWREHARQQQQ